MLSTCFLPVTAAVMGGGGAASGEIQSPSLSPLVETPRPALGHPETPTPPCVCVRLLFICLHPAVNHTEKLSQWTGLLC